MKKRICVLASGGLDSSVLVGDMLRRGYEVYPFYVRAGHLWEKAELSRLKRYLRALKGPRLRPLTVAEAPVAGLLGRHWSVDGRGVPSAGSPWDSVYLPGRNVLLLGLAGVFCAARGIPAVAFAILKGNPFPDATPAFRRRMQAALRAGLREPIRVLAPYAGFSKEEVVRRGRGLPLELTFSCLKPRRGGPCGACSKCEERRRALEVSHE